MSSGTASPPPISIPTPPVALPATGEREGFIDERLRQTRLQLKIAEAGGAATSLAAGVVAYLFAGAMLDHWLIVGGLGTWGRGLLWLGLVAGAGSYFVLRVWPPLVRRVNPIYAAATIEKSRPSLKNSLINFLLLRHHRREVALPIYRAIESRAAEDLASVRIETAVDRGQWIRAGCVLAALVAAAALYLVFSPKNPLRSAARILLPWAAIDAPTRVAIRDVRPGDATAFLGESLDISAEVAGLHANESLLLVYRSADGQTVDQTLPMTVPEGEYRYQVRFPPGNLGLQQDYEYYLSGGDCRSPRYRISTRIAPAIVVDRVEFHYPAYTGLPAQTVERQGDLRAIEGTEIVLHASANTDIKPNSAEIDLGCTGRNGVRMEVDGRKAVGRFLLRMASDDPRRPKYDSYMLRMADAQGRENLRPIRHRIDVIADLPPEVAFVDRPAEPELRVPENGSLSFKIRAEDPDFGLRRVALRAERDGRGLALPTVLEKPRPEKALAGEFIGDAVFMPAKLGLRAGDRVQYWAEAEDNREPTANRSVTDRGWIVVVPPDAMKPQDPIQEKQNNQNADGESQNKSLDKQRKSGNANPQEPSKGQDNQNDSSQSERSGDGQSESRQQSGQEDRQVQQQTGDGPSNDQSSGTQSNDPQAGAKGEQSGDAAKSEKNAKSDNGQKGEKSEKGEKGPNGEKGEKGEKSSAADRPPERINPDTDPGAAMEEILKDRQKEQGRQETSSDGQQGKPQPLAGEEAEKGEQQAGDGGKSEKGEKGEQQTSEGSKSEKGEKGETQQGVGEKGAAAEGEKGGKPDGRTPAGDEGASGREKTPDSPDAAEEQGKTPEPSAGGEKPSRSTEKRPSETPGETSGDRSGAGDVGEGQRSPNTGTGSPGSHTPAEQGGQLDQGNGDEVGGRPGDVPATDAEKSAKNTNVVGQKTTKGTPGKTGEEAPKVGVGEKSDAQRKDAPGEKGADGVNGEGNGKPIDDAGKEPVGPPSPGKIDAGKGRPTGDKPEPGQKPSGRSDTDQPGTPLDELPEGVRPGRGASDHPQSPQGVSPGGGGSPDGKLSDAEPPEAKDGAADEANAEYARRQTELALEHLRDVLAREKPELLDRLGWTKDDARRFLERWEEMRRKAGEPGERGETAKKQFDDAIRSLGFRPRGAELRGDGVAKDRAERLRDPARFAPPPDWAEQFRAYTRGVGGADRDEKK